MGVRCCEARLQGFKATTFKDVLWTAATATTVQYFDNAMEQLKKLDNTAYEWFEDKDPSQWSRAHFLDSNKCDVLLNNMCEVFNSMILDARDKPILTLMSMIKDLILVRMQCNRDKAASWIGKLCPKPRKRLLDCVKAASGCMPLKCDKSHFQVFSGTSANQCAVDLDKRSCTCRKWQLTGIPCKHACAALRLNGDNVEDYVDECYTIDTYKKVYAFAIQPMAGVELWVKSGREGPAPPPMAMKKAGRRKRLRKTNPFETEDNGKTKHCKVRKYLCKICREPGHNMRACKKKRAHSSDNEATTQATTQESRGMASSSQATTQSNITQVQQRNSLLSTFASTFQATPQTNVRAPTGGVNIRAPPQMVGGRAPFRPPIRASNRAATVYFAQGKKFSKLRDITKD